jgi:hypothetical protein
MVYTTAAMGTVEAVAGGDNKMQNHEGAERDGNNEMHDRGCVERGGGNVSYPYIWGILPPSPNN